MSRIIDPESVLTEEEVAYLTARGREDVLAQNAAFLINRHSDELVDNPNGDPAADVSSDPGANDGQLVTTPEVEDKPVSYKSKNKDELIELAQARGLDVEGTKEDLIGRLTESDEAGQDNA